MLTSRSRRRKVYTAYIVERGKAVFKEEKVATLPILAALIAISALIASTVGVIVPAIYKPIASDEVIPFTFGQDVISLVAAILLLITIRGKDFKSNILQAGIVAYLFYAYAPYVMGTLYNYFYFLYMAVVSLSIFYFVCAFTGIEYERLELTMPDALRIILAACCAAIVIYFAPQWVSAIVKDIQTNRWPGNSGFRTIYYVYILDLCFVLPVCAVASIFILQKKNLGFILGGTISVLGLVLMLSVASGFVCQPLFDQKMSVSDVVQFSIISFVFALLVIFYLVGIKVERRPI
jgi:hypothetical protein